MHTLRLPAETSAQPHATVVDWLVQPGDPVARDQEIARLQSASAMLAIASPVAGRVVELLAPAGRTLAPGEELARIDETGQAAPAAPAPAAGQEGHPPMPENTAPPEGVRPLLLPQVGNTMEEGTILSWNVAEGDAIEPGQVLYEVETDKATVEIEAEQTGRLARIVVDEGQTVPVKTPVAYLGQDVAAVDAWLAQTGPQPPGADRQAEASAKVETEAPTGAAAAGPTGPVTPLLMPQVGNTMEEGTILSWKVAQGDRIEPGQVIYEVETDKANVEVEAEQAGRLARIVLGEGETLAVKQPVAYLAENDDDVDAYLATEGAGQAFSQVTDPSGPAPAAQQAVEKLQPAPAKRSARQTDAGRIKASPAARKLAARRGVDLAEVPTGSGPGGRILTEDVPAASAGSAGRAKVSTAPARSTGAGQGGRQKLSKMRKAIGNALQASKQTVPHFYMTTEIRADAMLEFYRAQKARYKLSVNDLIVQACATCLTEFPAFRSRIDGDELVTLDTANIGIAVGMDEGLVVPVVLGAERLRLVALAEQTRRVVANARSGKLENAGKGCFTISNLGMFGVDEFSAIINPPEAAILAVGAAKETVIVENGAMRPGRVMKVTLSCDHRVVDGLAAAQFSARLKEILEAPAENLG